MAKADSYSVKLYGNNQRKKLNGCCSLYLRVTINSDWMFVPLGIDWPLEFIDNQTGIINRRTKNDQLWQDHQSTIAKKLTKITEIFAIYRIQDEPLSLDIFKIEYRNFDRRACFLAYFRNKINQRFPLEIDNKTKQNHFAALQTLCMFTKSKKTPFSSVTGDFFNRYKRYTLMYGHCEETIKSRIVIFKRYLKLARVDKIHIDAGVLDYKIGERNRRLVWLEQHEIQALIAQLQENLTEAQELALKAFLFGCFTGLRISDVVRASHNWITINNDLDFVMKKNSRNKPKRLIIPLTEVARQFIPTKSGKFFNIAEATINEKIKEVAQKAGITKHITMHVSRHTFGSDFIAKGGDVTILQVLMGHSKIKDTMIYVHIHEQSKEKRIQMEMVQTVYMIPKMRAV